MIKTHLLLCRIKDLILADQTSRSKITGYLFAGQFDLPNCATLHHPTILQTESNSSIQ